jgi:hypothetical protein
MPIVIDAPPLAAQVGCVDHPDLTGMLERVRHEVMTIPDDWVIGYGEFQSGGWGTLSLLNVTGNARDATAILTGLLARMPATAALLERLGLDYMWARLALLAPGAYLWEHRDYQEPDLTVTERHRLHIPITTSSAAFLVLAGRAVHLEAGKLWRLTPTFVHGACNRAGPARIHLLLDCYASPSLAELRAGEQVPGTCVRELPQATEQVLAERAATARRLAALGYLRAAEQHLLRLFFTHALPEGHAYDMIADMHAARGDVDAAARWRARKPIMLGTRPAGTGSVNDGQ